MDGGLKSGVSASLNSLGVVVLHKVRAEGFTSAGFGSEKCFFLLEGLVRDVFFSRCQVTTCCARHFCFARF